MITRQSCSPSLCRRSYNPAYTDCVGQKYCPRNAILRKPSSKELPQSKTVQQPLQSYRLSFKKIGRRSLKPYSSNSKSKTPIYCQLKFQWVKDSSIKDWNAATFLNMLWKAFENPSRIFWAFWAGLILFYCLYSSLVYLFVSLRIPGNKIKCAFSRICVNSGRQLSKHLLFFYHRVPYQKHE